jgi:hypothetical protein
MDELEARNIIYTVYIFHYCSSIIATWKMLKIQAFA